MLVDVTNDKRADAYLVQRIRIQRGNVSSLLVTILYFKYLGYGYALSATCSHKMDGWPLLALSVKRFYA